MASVIEICNRALSNIGNSRSINSLTEASKEAGQCSLHFDSCRDAALADFDWNFATKRLALADTNNPPPDWLIPTSIRLTACASPKLWCPAYVIPRRPCASTMRLGLIPTAPES